jgi:hypothetical protein
MVRGDVGLLDVEPLKITKYVYVFSPTKSMVVKPNVAAK